MQAALAISLALMVGGLVAALVLYRRMKKLLDDTADRVDRAASELEKKILR